MEKRSLPTEDQPTRSIAGLALGLGALFLAVSSAEAGLCPPRCRCDDDSLRSSCAYGGLDIVPIQLNPEIRHLDLSGNRIAGVHMAFDFYSGLESLNLSSNLIHTLGSNNFRLQQQLISLNLSGNAIRILAKTALHGLATLRILDLSMNNITEIDEQAFRYTSELEWLNLSGNGISSLPEGLLRNLHRIRNLILRGNSLLDAPASNLALVPSLEQLNLADNLIEELGRNSLPSLPALVQLDLSNNVLRTITDEAFERTPGLQNLELVGNNLTSVPSGALSRLAVLVTLTLSRNPLSELHDLAFRNLFELRTLELDECAIAHVASRTFADNVNLEKISMEGNRDLSDLPTKLLYAAGNLRWISLRRCNLTSLQPTQFPVDGLASLRVGGNPLICNCSVHWLWNVLRMDERKNVTKLEVDSPEIVCADEEFAGKALMNLSEGSLRCRLNSLYLSLSAIGCLLTIALILGFVAHITRAMQRKRVPPYTTTTRPELLVYVGRPADELSGKRQEPYDRRLIPRTEDFLYEPNKQNYHQTRRVSETESLESRETNVYETPHYSFSNHRSSDPNFELFYQQQISSPSMLPSSMQLSYSVSPETHPIQFQEGVYPVGNIADRVDEQSAPEFMSLYRKQNSNHHQHLEDPTTSPDYSREYECDYDVPVFPQKSHIVLV